MKRNSKKVLTLLLAGALCAATVGGVSTSISAEAATAKTYLLSSVFKVSNDATIDSATVSEKETTKLVFAKKASEGKISSVEFNRDLAWKWFTAKDTPNYLSFTFAFADADYEELSFVFEATPYQSVEDGKAINTIKFVKAASGVDVKVYAGEEEPEGLTAVNVADGDMAVALSEDDTCDAGEYLVKIGDTLVGKFTNIGASYADNGKVDTLVMKGVPAEGKESTSIYFKKLNGQSFDNVTGDSSKSVTDDAAPVLVVNQEVSSFLMGTAFNLDYIAIDVLKDSVTIASSDRKFYQYNPTDTKVEGKNLSTSTYFMDTVYYKNASNEVSAEAKEGYEATSVWHENAQQEFVSIWFDLGDETFTANVDSETTTAKKVRYDLSWYAESTVSQTVGEDTREYIVLNRNEDGPFYRYITANDTTLTNDVADPTAFEAEVQKFNELLKTEAEDVYAGSNAKLQIPSVDWLIDDNNGHKALSFTISYKTPTSTSASTASNKKYNTLEISTASEGWYELKIFASDAAGNSMKYYLDEELVEVTSTNVWDIEEIPTFRFKVENKGIKPANGEDNDTLDNKIIGESYTMSTVNIIGASDEESAYKLYKLSDKIWAENSDVAEKLAEIKFDALNKEADRLVGESTTPINELDFMAIYLQAFKNLAKTEVEGVDFDAADAFEEIAVYDSTVELDKDSDEYKSHHNRFNWSATSRRFTAYEEGLYLIVADYWDAELSLIDRVPAYQLIEVEEKEDTIPGVSKWLENNLVAIILYGVAGVLLIAIVVLLFVKPSDETLEDVDKKAAKKNAKK